MLARALPGVPVLGLRRSLSRGRARGARGSAPRSSCSTTASSTCSSRATSTCSWCAPEDLRRSRAAVRAPARAARRRRARPMPCSCPGRRTTPRTVTPRSARRRSSRSARRSARRGSCVRSAMRCPRALSAPAARLVAVAGIARPERFFATVRGDRLARSPSRWCFATITGSRARTWTRFARRCSRWARGGVITTEKDAVRLDVAGAAARHGVGLRADARHHRTRGRVPRVVHLAPGSRTVGGATRGRRVLMASRRSRPHGSVSKPRWCAPSRPAWGCCR